MSTLLTLVVATAALVAIPGPNVALIVANSIQLGLRMGVITVLGTTAGVTLQLLLIVAGMAAVVEFAAEALRWIKWAGVVYLLWLGIRTWREPADDLAKIEAAPELFWRGCMLAAANPKTLLFNAAFIPQFVRSDAAGLLDGMFVALVYVFVLFVGDVLWAVFASSASRTLRRCATWRNRLTGALLAAAGIGLAVSRR